MKLLTILFALLLPLTAQVQSAQAQTGRAQPDGAQTNGARTERAKPGEAQTDGAQAEGTKPDGARADEAQAEGTKTRAQTGGAMAGLGQTGLARTGESLTGQIQTECSHQTRTIPLPDPVSGRQYEIHVSLPDGFEDEPDRLWPVVVLADGGRTFPFMSCLGRSLAREGRISVDPVIVGLSYALGEDLEDSRRRDYTPVQRAGSSLAYGGASAYQTYLRTVVLPRIEADFRTDPAQRVYWGHSYGGLFGTHILLTDPDMFQTYLLGSPSYWYERGAINAYEEAWGARNRNLPARVLMYVGGLEISRYDRARRGNTRDMVKGMHDFEARLLARGYPDLTLTSTVLEGRDHWTAARPGFEWSLLAAFPAEAPR